MSANRQYFVYRDGQKSGPFSACELKKLKEQHELRPEDLIWTAGMTSSVPAANVEGLYRPARVPAAPPLPCPTGVVPSCGVGGPPPPRIPPPPTPPPLPLDSLRRSRFNVLAKKTAVLGKRAFYEACITAQAILLQTSDLLRHLASKARPADRQPLAVPMDRATRVRARVGCIILLLAALMLVDARTQTYRGVKPETSQAGTSAATPSNDEQQHGTGSLVNGTKTPGNAGGRQPEREEAGKLVAGREAGQSTLGMRVPVGASSIALSRYSRPRALVPAANTVLLPSLVVQPVRTMKLKRNTLGDRRSCRPRRRNGGPCETTRIKLQAIWAMGLQYIPADRSPFRGGGY